MIFKLKISLVFTYDISCTFRRYAIFKFKRKNRLFWLYIKFFDRKKVSYFDIKLQEIIILTNLEFLVEKIWDQVILKIRFSNEK